MSNEQAVRVRFAPSPTGELHLGSARTALYAYLLARHSGGTMILRIEDTDLQRFVPGSMDRFLADLQWLGIEIDEGPYIQSQRANRHREIALELVANGAAYYEFDSKAGGGAPTDDEYRSGRAAYRSPERDADQVAAKVRADAGEPFVIRLKIPKTGSVVIKDAVRGRIEFDLETVDDAVLLKSDGMGTYHLAATVDDHDMEISHVLRAEEWLPSTPKHVLLFQAMGWTVPQYVHLSFILANDGKKLSKRMHGDAVWISSYRKRGYLSEALTNYLALLGWNPGGDKELLSRLELIEAFSLERLHKAGAKFDEDKLRAFQSYYVRSFSDEELIRRINEFVRTSGAVVANQEHFNRAISVLKDRITTFDEVWTLTQPFQPDYELTYDAHLLIFRKSNHKQTISGLAAASEQLSRVDDATWQSEELLSQVLDRVVATNVLENGDVFWPVRVALTGLERSPAPAECLWVLGKDESLRRMKRALEMLE
ncbi:glutamate--tRNA ligase [Candidatus Berkelbacteria bacterium]|nr:glutamate--tRNA ligase [Candidatus Berkelbacteria bacterium]